MNTYTESAQHDAAPVPLDVYIRRLNDGLNNAYWEADDAHVQTLQQRIKAAKIALDMGESYHVPW